MDAQTDHSTPQGASSDAQSFLMTNRQNKIGLTPEQQAFMFYQISHGLRRKAVLFRFNQNFSAALSNHDIEWFMKNVDLENAPGLVVEAQKHAWFENTPPPFDLEEFKLGTVDWTAEQRAYIVFLSDRGASRNGTISSKVNSKFKMDCGPADIKRQLRYLGHTSVKDYLQKLMIKYEWWTEAPGPGTKGYAKMEKKIERDNAQARVQEQRAHYRQEVRNRERATAISPTQLAPHSPDSH